ncbi:MAG TPA: FAD-dependent oxidoreductase, partial [Hyphomicrobium sp.]|nr:FAD-dependent oxidoreductase [Hyphomicrobium sp.]
MTDRQATIAIIGGGFSGAAIAWHLARDARVAGTRVVVIEPRATLGQGLAYSPGEPAYRINVPASKMSLDAGD